MGEFLELFVSSSEEEAERLADVLSRVSSLEVRVVQGSAVLEDRVPLPFLRTRDGARIVGVEGIERFLLGQARASSAAHHTAD